MIAPEANTSTTVTRPPPGLARGVWEAPPVAFYLGAALLVVASGALLALRFNLFKRRSTR